MKKLLVVAVFAFGFFTTVKAQNVHFGIKAGANFANLNGGDVDLDGRTGLHAGVALELSLMEKFSLQPELVYSSQGAEVPGFSEINLDYISMPVLAKYYLAGGLSIDVGPQFAFLVNDGIKALNSDAEGVEYDGDKFDLGGAFGLGFKTPMGVFVQARYVIGFSETQTDSDLKNNVFQLSVGYNFK